MLEQQLLETGHVSSLASNRSSSMEYSSDDDGSSGSAQHISHPAELSAREVEALRIENEAIMKVRRACVGMVAIGHAEKHYLTHTS